MNIFEIIESTTSRTEPFHSRFLAAVLTESSRGDRAIFEQVWRKVAPREWKAPRHPEVSAEFRLGKEKYEGSVDIVIRSGDDTKRVVGIEVKTREESTEEGQLERYYLGLKDKLGCRKEDLAFAFLTPFNRRRAGHVADSLTTVSEFEDFTQAFPSASARHVSWLDVAEIRWPGNALWEQHRKYVRKHISTSSLLNEPRYRTLDKFFGHEAACRFRSALERLGIDVGDIGSDIDIDLNRCQAPQFAEQLANALEILICDGQKVSREPYKPKHDGFDHRPTYSASPFGGIHTALFNLAVTYEYVWVEGKENYALRVAHEDHRSSGVSLIRSVGPSALRVYGKR